MLSGSRVQVRAVTASDLALLRRWESDPAIADWMTTGASALDARETVEQEFERLVRTPRVKILAIQTVAAQVVGFLRLQDVDLGARKASVRILIGPEHQAKGYGGEAMRLTLRFCFLELGLHRLGLVVRSDNLHAIQLYRRLGFVAEGCERDAAWVAGRWVDFVHMGLLAPEWQEASE